MVSAKSKAGKLKVKKAAINGFKLFTLGFFPSWEKKHRSLLTWTFGAAEGMGQAGPGVADKFTSRRMH